MSEKIEIKGKFLMNVFKIVDGKKCLQETYVDDNLVVNLGKQSLIKLLANDGTTNYISQIAFGEGTSEPAAGDTDLTNKFIKNILGSSYSGMDTVNFGWDLLATEANGKSIAEYGLFTNGSTLFSRKIRTVVEKAIDIVLEGSWTIKFISCP